MNKIPLCSLCLCGEIFFLIRHRNYEKEHGGPINQQSEEQQ
jgi:hypothetical protein